MKGLWNGWTDREDDRGPQKNIFGEVTRYLTLGKVGRKISSSIPLMMGSLVNVPRNKHLVVDIRQADYEADAT